MSRGNPAVPSVWVSRDFNVALPGIPAWTDQDIDLYHGTLDVFVGSILGAVDVTQGAALKDFGRGFYTTTSRTQATNWANNLAIRGGTPAVICFTIERNELAQLDTLAFVRREPTAVDFWSFVKYCRTISGNHNRRQTQWYDVVIGPVTGSWTTACANGGSYEGLQGNPEGREGPFLVGGEEVPYRVPQQVACVGANQGKAAVRNG